MRISWIFLATIGAATSASYAPVDRAAEACLVLEDKYPESTLSYKDVEYTNETDVPWSTTCWLGPKCVFAPREAHQLSYAVTLFSKLKVKFAMRGSGHMPIAGANSIDSAGILISSTNLNRIELSEDRKTLSVGPGLRWTDVYMALDGTGLAVVGARLPPVGVAGLLLGGGVSFHSYEHGLASTNGNVKGYECVLADGRIVQISPKKHSDLFWALQGGGNSFCLVTRFDLRTLQAPNTGFGFPSYRAESQEDIELFVDGVLNFARNGHKDPKAAIIPVIQFQSGTSRPQYSSTLFYNGNDSSPAILQDFLGGLLQPQDNITSLSELSLSQYSQIISPAFSEGGLSHGLKQRFHLLPIKADREAMQIVHEAYFEQAQATFNASQGVTIGLAFNPITSKLLAASNSNPGALHGLDEQPAMWIEQTYSWKDNTDDGLIEEFVHSFNDKITDRLKTLDAMGSFYYMNEADKGQPVFESYPTGNVERLRIIRRKYDPQGVFTKLMPGGWKVNG